MPSAASLPHPADPADQQAEDALYYRRMLHELIDMGADLARAVHKQGTSQDGAADPATAAVAFDRISRCVRRTVALARKVAERLPQQADAGRQRAAARRRIIREVEDAIQREAGARTRRRWGPSCMSGWTRRSWTTRSGTGRRRRSSRTSAATSAC